MHPTATTGARHSKIFVIHDDDAAGLALIDSEGDRSISVHPASPSANRFASACPKITPFYNADFATLLLPHAAPVVA
jgi:hypothetical protein